jgi:hypothetical protein
MAGYPVTKEIIDSRAGFLAQTLRDAFVGVQVLKDYLDATPDADLVALGFTSEDVAVIKSSFTDLAKLGRIAHAQDTQAAASDFFFWAKRLTALA